MTYQSVYSITRESRLAELLLGVMSSFTSIALLDRDDQIHEEPNLAII